MMLKLVLVFVIINQVFCQDNTSLADAQTSMNVTDDVRIPSVADLPSNTTSSQDTPVMEEQADQPAEEAAVQPTRLPPKTPEASTFPPLVHQDVTTLAPATSAGDKASPEATTPGTPEAEKSTGQAASTKAPEGEKTTKAPSGKEGKNDAGYYGESFSLVVFSACIFRYFN